MTSESIAAKPTDELACLFWRIARRADELVRETQRGPGLNLMCWLIAEREMTGRLNEAAFLISHPAPSLPQ